MSPYRTAPPRAPQSAPIVPSARVVAWPAHAAFALLFVAWLVIRAVLR